MGERDVTPPGDAAPPPPRMSEGRRLYAIGDVHGRLDLFEELIGLIRRDNDDREPARVQLILLGDLIDRGPGSAELVDRCMRFAMQTDRFVVLKGNHEAMMLDSLSGNFTALALWLHSGGDAALSSWGVGDDLIAEGASTELLRTARSVVSARTLRWMKKLPLTYKAGDYLFVHAGIRPGIELSRQTEEDMLWIRNEFLDSEVRHPFVVVHGHSISEDSVVMRANRIGIDTGAFRTGILSALVLEADRQWTLATSGMSG